MNIYIYIDIDIDIDIDLCGRLRDGGETKRLLVMGEARAKAACLSLINDSPWQVEYLKTRHSSPSHSLSLFDSSLPLSSQ